jgi:hypothetical protein
MIGELDAGNPHVQFDEGAQETYDSVTRLCPTLPESPENTPPLLSTISSVPLSNRCPLFRRTHVFALNFCMSLFR